MNQFPPSSLYWQKYRDQKPGNIDVHVWAEGDVVRMEPAEANPAVNDAIAFIQKCIGLKASMIDSAGRAFHVTAATIADIKEQLEGVLSVHALHFMEEEEIEPKLVTVVLGKKSDAVDAPVVP